MPATDEGVLRLASPARAKPGDTTLLLGIGLSSCSALLLEVALTRLFSVVLFYHFAFLAISIAMLGLGAGGVFAHLARQRLRDRGLRTIAASCSAFHAVAIVGVLETVLHVPVSLELEAGNFLRLSVIYLCSAVPFFLTGLLLSLVFSRESSRIPRLYGADLAGGAVACLAVVGLLNWLGGPNTILFAALVSAFAAVVWSPATGSRRLALALAASLLLAMVFNHSGRLADVVWAKGARRKNVEFSRWNAISRIEVDRQDDGARVIVIDADASTYIMNADPGQWRGSEWEQRLMSAPAAVVNALRPHGEYAIIGPGGGVDVLRALANGSSSITGIEINGIIVNAIMRNRYADFAHHLYQRPEVHLQVGDGRSFIRNARQSYDVLEMTLVDTWASTAAGAFSLSENNLYTSQAFVEYFSHLGPEGIVAVTRWEFREPREALRVVSVAADALHRMGVAEISRHFIVVSADELDEDGVNVTVLAKKSDFTADEEARVKSYVAGHPPLELLYAPSLHETNAFSALIESNDPYRFAAGYPYNVSPVTDNAPFFFFTLKPRRLLRLAAGDEAMDWKVNLGVAVLLMLLGISFLAVLVFLFLPLLVEGKGKDQRISPLFYFVAIGLGYVLVEVALIQRFVLFLGHPTYAFTAVIFLLLLSSGAGSWASRRWLPDPRDVWMPLAVIGAALLVYVRILPLPLERWVGAPVPVKLAISAALLVPLGFSMGMPFPAGLRILEESRSQPGSATLEWAWAMNAAASVLGSVLAIAIAIQFGLNATLGCAAAAYLLALVGKLRLPARG